MNSEDSVILVTQLQQAHRLAVGFYRRILPTLDKIANQLDCTFWDWGPLHTSRPGRSTTQPSGSWSWDYIPLYASYHTYGRSENEKHTSTNDRAIEFYLYIEDTFEPIKRGAKGQPDPLTLPSGKAVLRVRIYRPKADYKVPFDDIWAESTVHEVESGEWASTSEHFEAVYHEWALEDLIMSDQQIIEKLNKYFTRSG